MALELDALRRVGVYQADAPLAQIFAELAAIEPAIAAWRGTRRGVYLTAGIVFVAGFAAVFFKSRVGVALLPASLVLAWIANRYAKKTMDGTGRLAAARQLLGAFEDDCAPAEPFHVRLALNDDGRVKTSESAWPERKKGHQKFFQSAWLSVSGQLLDGTHVAENVSDLVRERQFVNLRGKRRTKVRRHRLVDLRLRYPAKRYGDARRAPLPLRDGIKASPSASIRRLLITEKEIRIKETVRAPRELAASAGMLLLGAYRILNYARRPEGSA